MLNTKQKETANELAKATYRQSVSSINLGLTLAAALAWNEAVKHYILVHLRVMKKGTFYHLLYALIVTFLAAVVFMITQKYVDSKAKRANVMPALI